MDAEATGLRPSRGDYNRFVSFAFAATEMVAEVDGAGTITYAAGAFRSRMGHSPESFLGNPVADLVAPCDQDALGVALALLRERGRLLPCIVRLANPSRSHAVLAGLRLASSEPGDALCLTLGVPPMAAGSVAQATTVQRLIQVTQTELQRGTAGTLALLEVTMADDAPGLLAAALDEVAPSAVASEVAPGRFGVMSQPSTPLRDLLPLLEGALRRQGVATTIAGREIPLGENELTPAQASRTLKQALNVFARDGLPGVEKAGFCDGLASYVRDALGQAKQLRQAIAEREFSLLFQPIVSLADRRLHHYEALLRPAKRFAARGPQEFVSLIETAGLAHDLDLAVTAMGCDAAERHEAQVAINLSGHSVQDPEFRDTLMTLLRGSRAVRAGRILVEMTETAQVDRVEEAARTAEALRAAGIKFCIDDFGAGSADIRLLRAIPTDVVKLDGSFVSGIVGSGRERAFLAGMVEIAHAAGAHVVSERIETEAEAAGMAEIGVSYGQGWLYGRPAPLPELRQAPRPVRRQGIREGWG